MRTRFKRRQRFGRLIIPVLSVACLSYFGFHVWHGSFGLNSASALEVRRVELAQRLDEVVKRRETLERRVKLMSDGSIEADMLDERARLMLDVVRDDEIVYFN